MNLSIRSKHVLRAMIQLALNYGQGLMQIKAIAEGGGICDKYIEQMVVFLKIGGFVRSKKGPNGGYSLARKPSEIKVSMIVNAIEGSDEPSGCAKHKKFTKGCCGCVMSKVWAKLEKSATDLLDSTTLQDLIDMKK